jgi:hypothetical protein
MEFKSRIYFIPRKDDTYNNNGCNMRLNNKFHCVVDSNLNDDVYVQNDSTAFVIYMLNIYVNN